MVFEGPEPITFGIQASALKFDADGSISAMNQIAASSATLGLRAEVLLQSLFALNGQSDTGLANQSWNGHY